MLVQVALNPEGYQGGADSPDGSPFLFEDEELDTNPRLLIPPALWDVWDAWRDARDGLGGSGHLPDPGGVLQQPAAMLEAFRTIDAAVAAHQKRAPAAPGGA
jgi:hypothetical protein